VPRIRGISEKVRYAFNPLPEITDAVLINKAGLDELMEPIRDSLPPFRITWLYGGGLEAEYVQLNPQEFLALRESEVEEFLREHQELGMVVVEDAHDEEEVRLAAIKGLTKAATFYRDRGAKRLSEVRKNHGFSREEMEDRKYDHWAYYLNQTKAEVILELLKELKAQGVSSGKSKKGVEHASDRS
jgi:hypothetical protein